VFVWFAEFLINNLVTGGGDSRNRPECQAQILPKLRALTKGDPRAAWFWLRLGVRPFGGATPSRHPDLLVWSGTSMSSVTAHQRALP